ncbi:hypothetical protein HYDPIDRAFT_34048, partial [Hydnomerulius pinastri MD-312]
PYPHLTENLLAWLTDHPADRQILFYDKSNRTTLGDSTVPAASGINKKQVHGALAEYLFAADAVYGSAYTAQTAKFERAVGSRLTWLKDKYRTQLDRLKSTGAGIVPGDPKTKNLMESVLQLFPYFHECHTLWSGNPSFDSKHFNGGSSIDRTEDFLSLIKPGAGRNQGTAATSQAVAAGDSRDDEDQSGDIDPDQPDGAMGHGSEDPAFYDDGSGAPVVGEYELDPDVPMGEGDELGDEEEHDEYMHVDENDEGHESDTPYGCSAQKHFGGASAKYSQVGPIRTPAKPRTPSFDGRTAFRSSPYSRPPSSVSSFTSSSLSISGHQRQRNTPSHSSQTSLTKGKSSINQMRLDLQEQLQAVNDDAQDAKVSSCALKSERYIAKLNYHMREKEINYLEGERAHASSEMEDSHRRQLELKRSEIELRKADAEVLERETELFRMKIRLAELSAGAAVPSGSSAIAGPSGTQPGGPSDAA